MESTLSPRPAESSRKWVLFWRWISVLLFGWFFIRAIGSNRDDFLAYYAAGTRALHGQSPYVAEETPYRYLPATAYFFIPFAFFPVSIARVIFYVLNFGVMFSIYAAIRKRLGDFATFLVLALFFRFHNHDFGNAQINSLMLFLFFYWWETRHRNLVSSTLAFSVFGSFKIVQLALGLPLVVRGKWREISWIALWTVTLNFIPIFFYARGPLVFRDWYEQAKLIDDPVMLPNIQSIQAAAWWILDGHLAPRTFAMGMRTFQALLLLFVVARAPRRNREAWMFASTLAITVLISPLAWKHGYLLFIPLVALWFAEDPQFRERRTRLLYAVASFGLVVAPTLVGVWNTGFADRLYFMPWTGLFLVIAGILFARQVERNPVPL